MCNLTSSQAFIRGGIRIRSFNSAVEIYSFLADLQKFDRSFVTWLVRFA
mgnify:CR=1 FL=1